MKNKILPTCLALLFFQGALTGMESEIVTIGNILPSSKSLISTQVAGRVENVLVDVGSEVKKGQPIVQLDRRFYQIDLAQKSAALEAANVEMADAGKNFVRMQKLWDKGNGEAPSISLKRFEEAKTKYEQSAALFKQAQENFNRAKLNLEETTIKSPYDGIISKRLVDIGEAVPVQPVTNVVEIEALHPLYLEFSVPQVYLANLHKGLPLTFEIDGVELKNKTAQIDLFFPSLDETTRSLRCRAVLDNEDFKIRPGSLARVTINIAPQGNKP